MVACMPRFVLVFQLKPLVLIWTQGHKDIFQNTVCPLLLTGVPFKLCPRILPVWPIYVGLWASTTWDLVYYSCIVFHGHGVLAACIKTCCKELFTLPPIVQVPNPLQIHNPMNCLAHLKCFTAVYNVVILPCAVTVLCSAFEVDSDVQLVCKYLNAYDQKDDPIHGINRLYELPPGGFMLCQDTCCNWCILLDYKGFWANQGMESLIWIDSPRSEDGQRFPNQRQSGLLLSEDLWNDKGKERRVVQSGVKPMTCGLSCQYSVTELWHPPTATPPSTPFITLLWMIVDEQYANLDSSMWDM